MVALLLAASQVELELADALADELLADEPIETPPNQLSKPNPADVDIEDAE